MAEAPGFWKMWVLFRRTDEGEMVVSIHASEQRALAAMRDAYATDRTESPEYVSYTYDIGVFDVVPLDEPPGVYPAYYGKSLR